MHYSFREKPQYGDYKKPFFAPPAKWFGRVWSFLYVLIAVSYGYVVYLSFTHQIGLLILLPFVLNLLFNALFTPIQFGLRSFSLAVIDILLVLVTLVWALVVIFPFAPWVSIINVPYLLWVSFATILQITVTYMNRAK